MPDSTVKYVLDSHAIIKYFKREPGWETVESLFVETSTFGKKMLMSLINWGEVFYSRIINFGEIEIRNTEFLLQSLPIEVIPPEETMTIQAAIFKAMGGISYADCFAAALAKNENAILVTGDPEFKKLEKLGHIKIKWI